MLVWRKVEPRLLLPSFVDDLLEVFDADPATWYVLEGFRSIERSNELYKAYKAYKDGTGPRAPRAAPGGKSAHNFGLAIDFVLDGDRERDGLQMDWVEAHPEWIRVRSKVDAHPRLHGGWWFGDGDHIERAKWEDYKLWASR